MKSLLKKEAGGNPDLTIRHIYPSGCSVTSLRIRSLQKMLGKGALAALELQVMWVI